MFVPSDLANQTKVGLDKVVFVEKWEDLAALRAQSASPHMQAYRISVREYMRCLAIAHP